MNFHLDKIDDYSIYSSRKLIEIDSNSIQIGVEDEKEPLAWVGLMGKDSGECLCM